MEEMSVFHGSTSPITAKSRQTASNQDPTGSHKCTLGSLFE